MGEMTPPNSGATYCNGISSRLLLHHRRSKVTTTSLVSTDFGISNAECSQDVTRLASKSLRLNPPVASTDESEIIHRMGAPLSGAPAARAAARNSRATGARSTLVIRKSICRKSWSGKDGVMVKR